MGLEAVNNRIMRQVLIVGDSGVPRDMVAAAAECAGCAVVCVDDMAEAAADCKRGRFDRVVVIGSAPFFDGRMSVGQLRPCGLQRPELYVIGWHQSEHTVLGLLEFGVNQYIAFPVNLRRLCRKIGAPIFRGI